MTKFLRAAASPAGHGTPAEAFGRHVIRMMAANTGGTFGMFEAVVAPGEGPRSMSMSRKRNSSAC